MDGMLRRDALLTRLRRADPRVVLCVAPAGFGKSTLIQAYADELGDALLVSCDGVTGDLDVARRLAAALQSAELDQMLDDGGATIAQRLEATIAAWHRRAPRCTVFERLDSGGAAREFLFHLLASQPPRHTAVVAARAGLGPGVSRSVLPHHLVTLRAADLAFSTGEIAAVFGGTSFGEPMLEGVAEFSRGWPVVVAFYRRLADEGALPRSLGALDDPVFGPLREYMSSEVVDPLEPSLRSALLTAACVGDLEDEDLAAIGSMHAVEAPAERLERTGLLQRDGTVLRLYPVVAATLLHGRADRAEMLCRVAEAQAGAGRFMRAAELFLAAGDRFAAARALGEFETLAERAPSERYMRILARLDDAAVARSPRLWTARGLQRLYREPVAALIDEAETVWRTLPPACAAAERYQVVALRALLLAMDARLNAALETIDAFVSAHGANDPPRTLLDGHVLATRGLLRARAGRFDDAERDLNAALPLVERNDSVVASIYLTLGGGIARARGEWSVERQFLNRARERAVAGGGSNVIARVIAEALFGAWFAGDRAASNALAVELEQSIAPEGTSAFAFFCASARGRIAEPTAADLREFVVAGRLIALSRSRDEAQRAALASEALAGAQELDMPFLTALAAVALALCDQARFEESAELARAAAVRCDAPALTHAINAFAQQHENIGMLSSFVSLITRDRSDAAPLAIEVLAGRVRVDGVPVRVSGREFELLAALAQRREPTSRVRLASMLWPDLDEFAARNALSVCLHRLRAHLRRDDAIERESEGYRLHADAFVDLWEIERAGIVLRAREVLREADRALLGRAFDRLRVERMTALEQWEWFAPALRRLEELRADVVHRLAADALDRGDPEAALAFAAAGIDADPSDEPAREIAIRAHLAIGDRAAALRQYRQYRDVLRDEFGTDPPESLTRLIMS